MGPRSGERGNSHQIGSALCSRRRLQWGRAQVSAEIPEVFAPSNQLTGLLQWGRAQVSAEIRTDIPSHRRTRRLQWGRAQVSAEITISLRTKNRMREASMGPRSGERGNPYMSPESLERTGSFN